MPKKHNKKNIRPLEQILCLVLLKLMTIFGFEKMQNALDLNPGPFACKRSSAATSPVRQCKLECQKGLFCSQKK